MLLQNSILVWACSGKCAAYSSPVLIPTEHELPCFPDLLFCHLLFVFLSSIYKDSFLLQARNGKGPISFKFSGQIQTDLLSFCSDRKNELFVDASLSNAFIAEQQSSPQQMGLAKRSPLLLAPLRKEKPSKCGPWERDTE